MQQTITIRIPVEMKKALRIVCREDHVAMSNLIRESLRRIIAIRQFRRLRRKMLPYAQSQGFLTDEDVFNAVS